MCALWCVCVLERKEENLYGWNFLWWEARVFLANDSYASGLHLKVLRFQKPYFNPFDLTACLHCLRLFSFPFLMQSCENKRPFNVNRSLGPVMVVFCLKKAIALSRALKDDWTHTQTAFWGCLKELLMFW